MADDEHVLLDDNVADVFDCRTVPTGVESPPTNAASELDCMIAGAREVAKN